MPEIALSCHACGHSWSVEPPLGRRDECPGCRRDAKVCRNCRFFDQGTYRECREEQAEWVKDKTLGNFCSYFAPGAKGATAQDAAVKARDKLSALFAKGQAAGETPESKPGDSLAEQLKAFLEGKK